MPIVTLYCVGTLRFAHLQSVIVIHFKFDTLSTSPCCMLNTVFGLSSRLKIKVNGYIYQSFVMLFLVCGKFQKNICNDLQLPTNFYNIHTKFPTEVAEVVYI